MVIQQLFYQKVVPISAEWHRNWHLRSINDYTFTAGTNSVPLMIAEFIKASLEYPIVFVEVNNMASPAILLGLHKSENEYVSEHGEWKGHYIPAFIRRYPFVFAKVSDEENKYALCIDECYSGCNQEGQGEALIGEDGKPSEATKKLLGFMEDYQKELQRTQVVCKKVKELNLLEGKQATISQPDGSKETLRGFSTIERSRVQTLSEEALLDLVRSGIYELICHHWASLQNFDHLLQKAQNS